jgi:hypothetical protein
MADWWTRNITEPGKLPLFLLVAAFVVTFLVTRTITRLIRAGRGPFSNNVSASGLHVHHAVPGLILLLIGAFVAIGSSGSPWHEIAGVLVGIGASLVLDEFALILHLDDVYWSEEGETSVQMVALTAMCLLAALIGLTPFGVDDVGGAELGWRVVSMIVLALTIACVVVCAMKGKYRLGLLAVFVPVVAYAGAVRLARPGSRWATRRYADRPERAAEATGRAARFDARWDPRFRRIGDLIAGSPNRTD